MVSNGGTCRCDAAKSQQVLPQSVPPSAEAACSIESTPGSNQALIQALMGQAPPAQLTQALIQALMIQALILALRPVPLSVSPL